MTEPSSHKPDIITPSGFTPLDPQSTPAPPPRRPGRLLLWGGLALAALVMTFLLTARSLHVNVVAEAPADVSVSGLALPLGEHYLVRPGDYEVRAKAPGYHPLVTSVTVGEEEDPTVELVLQPLPGRLSIDTTPPGARVSIDGETVGETPLTDLPVEKGERRLLLEEARHLPLEQVLQVEGRDIQQKLQLQLEPAWAEVSVDSTPAGAVILVDGEPVGETPLTVEMLQGERQLVLQKPAFADWQRELEIVAGENRDLGRIELQPALGSLTLSSEPAGANVTLDGEFQGQTPLNLEFTPGEDHRLAVFKPGYERYNGTVRLPAGGSDERVIKLKARLGEVHFRVRPATAVVAVNGTPRGKGDMTLSLPAVEHTVTVSLEGYATARRKVTPRPGLAQLVEVALQTEQAARVARVPPEVTTAVGQTLLLFNPADSGLANFTMGASRREPGRRANEVLHPVALTRMFYLQTTEVTNAQFRQFQPGHNSGQVSGNSLNRDHQPVVKVSWQQAAAFCNWLSAKEGLPPFYREKNGIISGFNPGATGYRLPSEAEWAWAARSKGTGLLLFPWGETFPPTQPVENYADNTSAYVTGRILNDYRDGHVVSATVASFKPNQHRLYDMGGNVSEWVNDVYSIPRANGATRQDPLGSQGGDNYVIRGASWTRSKLSELRLSYRDYGQAGRDDVGFRIARYAE